MEQRSSPETLTLISLKKMSVQVKDVRLPQSLQRAMAAEAEAAREARAKVIILSFQHNKSLLMIILELIKLMINSHR